MKIVPFIVAGAFACVIAACGNESPKPEKSSAALRRRRPRRAIKTPDGGTQGSDRRALVVLLAGALVVGLGCRGNKPAPAADHLSAAPRLRGERRNKTDSRTRRPRMARSAWTPCDRAARLGGSSASCEAPIRSFGSTASFARSSERRRPRGRLAVHGDELLAVGQRSGAITRLAIGATSTRACRSPSIRGPTAQARSLRGIARPSTPSTRCRAIASTGPAAERKVRPRSAARPSARARRPMARFGVPRGSRDPRRPARASSVSRISARGADHARRSVLGLRRDHGGRRASGSPSAASKITRSIAPAARSAMSTRVRALAPRRRVEAPRDQGDQRLRARRRRAQGDRDHVAVARRSRRW